MFLNARIEWKISECAVQWGRVSFLSSFVSILHPCGPNALLDHKIGRVSCLSTVLVGHLKVTVYKNLGSVFQLSGDNGHLASFDLSPFSLP